MTVSEKYLDELRERITTVMRLTVSKSLVLEPKSRGFLEQIYEYAKSPQFRPLSENQYKWFRSIELNVAKAMHELSLETQNKLPNLHQPGNVLEFKKFK